MISRILLLLVTVALVFGGPAPIWAKRGGFSIIRDAEIEHTIRLYAAPVLEAAGLDSSAVRVHLVNSNQLNAFVAGGQRIFLFTGLLLRVETPNQLIGVIAHETGHISGGHLARTQDALRDASTASIISFVLGAAAIVAGAGQVGAAVITGGGAMARRTLIKYSRVQESAADQAAMTYLDRTGQSGRGLLRFLDIMGDQEALVASRQDPYARTHPVSRERINALQNRVDTSPFRDRSDPADHVAGLARMQAKLYGFLKTKAQTLRKYPPEDRSVPAAYARVVAYFRVAEVAAALAELDRLIAEAPDDPFFHELKGQILFENGRIAESIEPNRAAVRLLPNSPLIRLGLGQVLVATEDPKLNRESIGHLEEVVRIDPRMGSAWAQLAIAYGRDGQLGESALASAERYFIRGDMKEARQQAQRAQQKMAEGTPGWLRAMDIERAADKRLDH